MAAGCERFTSNVARAFDRSEKSPKRAIADNPVTSGNLPELLLTQPYGKSELRWNEQFGSTYRFKGCFSEDLLLTSDPATIRFIVNDAKLFDFTANQRLSVVSFLGEKSMLGLRNGGEDHRRIKNAFSPAFTLSRIHSYVPVMMDIAQKATDRLNQHCSKRNEHNGVTIDISHLLQHITSDIIGEAWLAESVRASDSNGTDTGIIGFATHQSNNQKREPLSHDSVLYQSDYAILIGKCIGLGILRACKTFSVARTDQQEQIRKEIIEAQTTSGIDVNLDKLEHLNAHIKETLRFHPSVPLTEREAFENTVLPLSRPLTTSSGRVVTELPIKKGQTIYLGLASCNRNPHVWGEDASSFDPMRWLDGRYDPANLPGIGPFPNLASFSGGGRFITIHVYRSRWRLAILEMQVVLFELLSKFRFSFSPEQENNLTSSFALNLLPLDVASGKPGLSLLVQPAQAREG
ncbi:cytochrome P450 [Marasmius fiardii PR-910]|nr:cytochrome P450 [Marasmius fiardii PR-910]